MVNIAIIGSGYVGKETGKLLSNFHNVIYYDISEEALVGLENTTTYINEAVQNSEAAFICTPTPTLESKIDLSIITSATENLAKAIRDKKYLVVMKSTVIPETTRKVVKPILDKHCSNYKLCMNPEFITQIAHTWTEDESLSGCDDKIIIGELDKESGDALEEIYKSYDIPKYRMSLEEAEFIKYASNCCLASRISFFNELFLTSKKLGNIDTQKLAEILATDRRIGKYGTVHGKAFGGTCFPKDTQAFLAYLEEQGFDARLLKAVIDINNEMREKYGVRE